MKKVVPLFLLTAVLLIFSSCEGSNGLYSIPARSIFSVVFDPVADCVSEQVHQHNDEYYSGHYNNDGHKHYGLRADDICTLSSCKITALHEHNGIQYAGHHSSDGHLDNDNHGGHGINEPHG